MARTIPAVVAPSASDGSGRLSHAARSACISSLRMCGGALQYVDYAGPIVRRRLLDPARQIARRDVLQVAERRGPGRLSGRRSDGALLQRRDLRLGVGALAARAAPTDCRRSPRSTAFAFTTSGKAAIVRARRTSCSVSPRSRAAARLPPSGRPPWGFAPTCRETSDGAAVGEASTIGTALAAARSSLNLTHSVTCLALSSALNSLRWRFSRWPRAALRCRQSQRYGRGSDPCR